MQIAKAEKHDAELLASLVSRSNRDVAELLKLNIENAPKHPSLCTVEWILSDFERGQEFFLATDDDIAQGCVAFEQPDAETAYLNRLAVLPAFRHKGVGASLVHHVIGHAQAKRIKAISIGTIAEHSQLTAWYLKLGFIKGQTQKFDHLPFTVLFMRYEI